MSSAILAEDFLLYTITDDLHCKAVGFVSKRHMGEKTAIFRRRILRIPSIQDDVNE